MLSLSKNYKIFITLLSLVLSVCFSVAQAGGVGLGATRLIFSSQNKQASLSINNTDDKNVFLIKSWVEDKEGKVTSDFLVTPPLFLIKQKRENILRVMSVNKYLATDRETVYWLNVKAIPSRQKDTDSEQKNALQLAIQSRIKLFYRPVNLQGDPMTAYKELTFSRVGNVLTVKNPTPYYVNLVNIKSGDKKFAQMIAPKSSEPLNVDLHGSNTISFQAINDYGATMPVRSANIN
ncbi:MULTISPECIES: molecular chaperone [unclassified Pantoea]|uniref:fimbrial biogenesis chaperone n=1 Tax=unclassified Pantoea TaxID=2630326 RepID=UPI001232B48C|nr:MULTISPECIES: fimbria/pilus periplasmic chaperone [unclassified Pantoea]KAA5956046.1 fimbria/pilus periplasmic chaperone [Pantoea sp. VH_24]KAA5956102.1 fimbria/pilus periplasmic chaperone [Pantoea sp. VH_16]KAA5964804.1 fimbria/pilus periplasmic chaperone [Pantoea sp. VH_18]KAA5995155.1 fimbria/pilus periplasmic chaperone [Pantoea sp. M_1]KAA6005009.1 fimbria/pilus periplasmic chaperone [Pantoea sp. F_7]